MLRVRKQRRYEKMQLHPFQQLPHSLTVTFRLFPAILLSSLLLDCLIAQTGKITGKVTERGTGEPLVGANVQIVGTFSGGVTDVNGEFLILNVPFGIYKLNVSYVGYTSATIDSIEVQANATTTLTIQLVAQPIMTQEVEIVGKEKKSAKSEKKAAKHPKDETGKTIVESEESVLSGFFQSMKWGNLVFSAPDSMGLYQFKAVHAVLSLTKSGTQLQEMMKDAGVVKERKIRVSNIMAARLKGEGFRIEPLTETLQAVDFQGETQWQWQITALQPGAQKLYLAVDAIINIDGRDMPHTVHSLYEQIQIHVAWHQQVSRFVAANWQWLWTAVALPMIGWIWERRKKSSTRRTKH
jgi:hypothetical protein